MNHQWRTEVHTLIEDIRDQIAALELHMLTLHTHAATYVECHSLDAGQAALDAGTHPYWPGDPTSIQTKTSNGNEYAYLQWRTGRRANGPQPDGPDADRQARTYIGADPARLELAKLMIDNRPHATQLQRATETARRDLNRARYSLSLSNENLRRAIENAAAAITKEEERHG